MGATRTTTQHDQHKSPAANPPLPQGLTSGQKQLEQGLESGLPLHRYLGNSYVQAMPTTPQRLGLQAKLTVNEPRDIYEQEADRVADQVMGAPTPANVRSAPLQIQRFSNSLHGQTDAAPASVGQTLASPGRPLDPLLRQDMEQRFGHDFSAVRVHADAAAEQSARDVNAQAYTLGHNIVFGAGQFAPGTADGRRLIAHELTHVVQQSGAKGGLVGQAVASPVLQRKPDGKSPSEAADPIEEKNFPEYAWHRVGTTSTHGRPGAAVIREIVAENTNIGRELLVQTTSKFTYRERTVGPSYYSFTHPTRGIVVRACAILHGFHPEREPNPKVLAKESHSYSIYVFSPHSDKDPEHYNLPLPLSSAPPPDKESEEREKRRKTAEALPRLEEALRKAEEERARDEYYQAILAYYVSPQKAADLKARDENYQAMLAYSASTRQSVLEHQAAALRAEVANMPVRQIYSQWKARKAAFLSVALSPDHRLNREQLFEIWRLYWGDRNEAAQSSYGQIKYLPEKDRMAAVEAAEREEAATASMLRTAVDINEFLRAAEANGKHVTFQRINEVAMRWAGYRNAWINASAMFGARGALGSPSLPSLRLPKAPTVAPTAVRPAPPAVSARPPAVSVPGPKPIPVKVSGSTPAPGAPLEPVRPAGAAKNSPPLSFPRRDLIGGPFPLQPAKPAAPAPAPIPPAATGRTVGAPASMKPTPPAASVSRPPASPLSRWDRVKGRLRTKYLEAAMRSKLDEVVPTKIAGGSLPGQRPAVTTAKAPMPSPAPTPTPLPRTSARPPTVNPAQTRTPVAPSRPATTGEVVKTPAPATPTSPAATRPTARASAPAPQQGGKTFQGSPVQVSVPRVYTPQAANENVPPEGTPQQQVVELASTGTDVVVGPVKIIKGGKRANTPGLRSVASGERETPGQGVPVVGVVQPSNAPAPSPPQRPSPTPPPGGNFENEPTDVDRLAPSASQGEQPVSRHIIRRSQFTSPESLNAFLTLVWLRRPEILAAGNADGVYDLYRYKPDSASRTELSNEQRAGFIRSQETLAQEQGFPRLTPNEPGELAGRPGRRDGRVQFSIQQGDPETGFLHFYNRRIEPGPNQLDIVERIYLCVKAENALEVMRFVTTELVNNAQTTGIGGAKLAGPGEVGRRRDAIVIYSEGSAYTQRAVERLREYQRTHPNHFEDFPVPMTQPVSRGMSIGSDPVGSSEEVSFGSVRAEAIYDALREATSREDFFRRVEQNFRSRRVDPAQPRSNLPPPIPPPSRPTQPLRRR